MKKLDAIEIINNHIENIRNDSSIKTTNITIGPVRIFFDEFEKCENCIRLLLKNRVVANIDYERISSIDNRCFGLVAIVES